MEDRKPYCREGESDSVFALGAAIALGTITFVLGVIGIISLF